MTAGLPLASAASSNVRAHSSCPRPGPIARTSARSINGSKFFGLLDAATHQLGTLGNDRGDVLGAGGDRDESRTDSQRRFAGHPRGARHADATADDEDPSLLAFVSRAATRRQRASHIASSPMRQRGRLNARNASGGNSSASNITTPA